MNPQLMHERVDLPLTDPSQDRFQRWPFARAVASTIRQRRTPECLVVGLYGPWGEGKTTVLNYIDLALRDGTDRPPVVVSFNPWRYGDEATLLTQFFATLADAIGADLRSGGDKVAAWLREYGTGLAAVAGKSSEVEAIAKATSKTTVDDLRARIAEALQQFEGRVTVLVDDVDRLRRRDIQLLFRIVALTADFPRTTYVLAFDPEIVADALSEEYGYQDEKAGLKFLEKIVHVPLPIPQVEQGDLRVICAEGIQQALSGAGVALDERAARKLAKDLEDCVQPLLQTARTAKRVGRVLEFLLPLVKDELNPSDFVLFEALHILLPDIHAATIRDTGYFVSGAAGFIVNDKEHKEEGAALFERLLMPYDGPERRAAEKLIARLFPAAVGISQPTWYSGSADSWMREQRVCSLEYFSRYVTYAVRPGDIADAKIAQVLGTGELDPASVESPLRQLLAEGPLDKILVRLRLRSSELSAALSEALVRAISAAAVEFEVEWPLFSLSLKPRSQAAILILELLRQVPPLARPTILIEAMKKCPSPALVQEVLRWLRSPEAREINTDLLSEGTVEDLSALLLAVVRKLAAENSYFPPAVGSATQLLRHWAASDPSAVKEYLLTAVQEEPSRLEDFLVRLMSRTTDDAGKVVYLELSREGFEGLGEIVEPGVLETPIRQHFAITDEVVSYSEDRNLAPAHRAAVQLLARLQARRRDEEAPSQDVTAGGNGLAASGEP